MTNEEAAIISAYFGISFGGNHFSHFHKYAEKLVGRPIFTHEFSSKELMEQIKKASFEDIKKIVETLGE